MVLALILSNHKRQLNIIWFNELLYGEKVMKLKKKKITYIKKIVY